MEKQENTPLENEEVRVTNIKLVEKSRADGTTWKEYSVSILDQVRGTFYTLPIKKADGNYTKAYEVFKDNKSAWEEKFIEGEVVSLRIAYSEKSVKWDRNGKTGISTYRTIRFLESMEMSDEPVVKKVVEEEGVDITQIPF